MVLIIVQDSLGAVTGVTISNMMADSTASDQWATSSAPSTSEVTTTATTVTFTNLVVPGYAAASTTTSLTLNGTLNFDSPGAASVRRPARAGWPWGGESSRPTILLLLRLQESRDLGHDFLLMPDQ